MIGQISEKVSAFFVYERVSAGQLCNRLSKTKDL
jgi:hypothetical protein